MAVSEARINANQFNGRMSTCPRTPEGKSISRANSLKHGLSGEGVVIPQEDVGEVEARAQALQAELDPKSAVGMLMVRQLALLSIRMDRAGDHETAAIAMKVRHAVEAFDDERFEEAERLMDSIGEEPRINLRKLRKSPEGVDRMIEEWTDLRDDLNREYRPLWTAWHMERAVNMMGLRIEALPAARRSMVSRKAIWGGSHSLEELEIDNRENNARKAQARKQLSERIDAEIASLKAHRETLDLEMIELDRAGAPSRALFDPSKEATLARRYESEASRRFFKLLKDLRRVEAEHAALAEPESPPEMGSSREIPPPAPSSPSPRRSEEQLKALDKFLNPVPPPWEPLRGMDGRVVRVGLPPNPVS